MTKADDSAIPYPFRKLSKALIDAVIKDIAEGSPKTLAAASNGITPRIFELWYKQGEKDMDDELDTLPAYLFRTLSQTRKNEIKKCRKNIINSQKGHRGAEWTLEHAYWRHYGSNVSAVELAKELDDLKASIKNGERINAKVDSKE